MSLRQNKKNMPQWVYNAGEEVTSLQVIQVNEPLLTLFVTFSSNSRYNKHYFYRPVATFLRLLHWENDIFIVSKTMDL